MGVKRVVVDKSFVTGRGEDHGAARLHREICGSQSFDALPVIHKSQLRDAADGVDAHAAGIALKHPERDVRAEPGAPVRRLRRYKIADPGLDDLRSAGKTGVAVRDDVADADEKVGLQGAAVDADGKFVAAGFDLAEVCQLVRV